MVNTATKKRSPKPLRMSGSVTPKPKRGRPPGSKDRVVAEPVKSTWSMARGNLAQSTFRAA